MISSAPFFYPLLSYVFASHSFVILSPFGRVVCPRVETTMVVPGHNKDVTTKASICPLSVQDKRHQELSAIEDGLKERTEWLQCAPPSIKILLTVRW